MNYGTHNYVGCLPCGCGVAIVADMPDYTKDTAKDVAKMIEHGYEVQRLPHKEAGEMFSRHCAEYPHTDWQRRNEAERLRASELPLSADAVE